MEMLYDLSLVNGIAGDNPDFVRSLLNVFIHTAPADGEALLSAANEGDGAGVARAAHKLKSTIDTLQVHELIEPIRQIETLGKTGTADKETLIAGSRDILEKLSAAVAQAGQDPVLQD